MNGRAVHIADDGTQTDITEGVQALYDLVLASMDWGSGFLSYEDALPVAKVGRLFGFEQSEEAERYLRQQQHSMEQAKFLADRSDADAWAIPVPDHDHVFSSAGKCMWRWCNIPATATT